MSFHLRSYFESKPLMIIALSSNHSRKQGKVFKSTATAISWIYFLLGSAIDAKYIEKKTKSVYNQGEGTYISGFWLPQNPKMSFLYMVLLSSLIYFKFEQVNITHTYLTVPFFILFFFIFLFGVFISTSCNDLLAYKAPFSFSFLNKRSKWLF